MILSLDFLSFSREMWTWDVFWTSCHQFHLMLLSPGHDNPKLLPGWRIHLCQGSRQTTDLLQTQAAMWNTTGTPHVIMTGTFNQLPHPQPCPTTNIKLTHMSSCCLHTTLAKYVDYPLYITTNRFMSQLPLCKRACVRACIRACLCVRKDVCEPLFSHWQHWSKSIMCHNLFLTEVLKNVPGPFQVRLHQLASLFVASPWHHSSGEKQNDVTTTPSQPSHLPAYLLSQVLSND